MRLKKEKKSSENSWKIGVYQSVFDYFFIWLLEADFTAKFFINYNFTTYKAWPREKRTNRSLYYI